MRIGELRRSLSFRGCLIAWPLVRLVMSVRVATLSNNRKAEDMANTAILSIQVAVHHNVRERMIDAANYCFLAYRRMEDTGTLDDSSPGVVENGIITKARGKFEHLNGCLFALVDGS
jgi:hypothetical protein